MRPTQENLKKFHRQWNLRKFIVSYLLKKPAKVEPPRRDETFPYEHAQVGQPDKVG